MVKKLTKQQVQRYKRHRLIIGISVALLGLLIAATAVFIVAPAIGNSMRKDRIEEIYSKIPIPEKRGFYQEDIFGDKRPYDYDASRSKSSSIRFVIAANVDETFSNFDTLIRNAGFKFVAEPYPGAVQKQAHYKNDKGEYIRLTVSSKVRDDAGSNELLMKGDFSEDFFKIDANAGPSNVVIKVNLDDNNE